MKKQSAGILACLAALALSVTAHAEQPRAAVTAGEDGGTSITITDLTPREETEDEAKTSFAVGGRYPIEIQTAEDGGVRLLVKTFVVPRDTDPQALVEEGLTRRGIAYQVSDILRLELAGTSESKTVRQTVTSPADTDKTEELLALLTPTLEYSENGFSGTLSLDRGSISAKAADTQSYAYTLKDAREYTGLDRNDPYYIPKTTEKNGVTLQLADIQWTPMASAADNSEVPSLFRATAVYTGTAWGSRATGYLVTAAYTGEAVKVTEGEVAYSIVYEEVPKAGLFAGAGAFRWEPVLLTLFAALLIAGAVLAARWLIRRGRREEQEREFDSARGDPYAGRPPMDLPEMLDEMDRGLEEDRR